MVSSSEKYLEAYDLNIIFSICNKKLNLTDIKMADIKMADTKVGGSRDQFSWCPAGTPSQSSEEQSEQPSESQLI